MLGSRKKDRMMSLLFEREAATLRNIKFFRGDRDLVTEEEMCRQVHSAIMQERMGKASAISALASDDAPVLNVRGFVATL